MEHLQESIEKLRKENEFEKQEIALYLDQLVQVQDCKSNSFACKSPSENNYITELCKYEQQINHKLTEIKCELKKFVYLNKPPICKPTRRKSDVGSIDIETLKQNSLKLISKLEGYKNKDEDQLKSSSLGAISLNSYKNSNIGDVQYPYVSEGTIEKLSEHTKCMLKDLSTSSSKWPSVKTEDVLTSTHLLTSGHSPEIYEISHTLSKACTNTSLSSDDNFSKTSEYSLNSEDNTLLGLMNTCQVKQTAKILKEDDDNHTESSSFTLNNEFESKSDEKIVSFLEDISESLKIPSFNNTKSDDKHYLIDFEIEEMSINTKSVYENVELGISNNSCKEKYMENERVKPLENSKMVSKPEVVVNLLVDVPAISVFEQDDLEKTEISGVHSELVPPLCSNATQNHSLVPNYIDDVKLNNIMKDEISVQVNIGVKTEKIEEDLMKLETEQCKRLTVKLDKDDNKKIREEISQNQNFKDTFILKNNFFEDNLYVVDEDKSTIPEDFQSTSTQENLKDCNLSANVGRPIYSAQEKMIKLGLEDRMSKFEKTRNMAFFPDIRLQPAVTDNEKMNQLLHQGTKFEIMEKEIPGLYATCIFSHVESPFEFYLHLDDEESQLIDCLNDLITQHYRKTTTPYRSKFETFEKLGNFCCAYVKDDKTYYRAEVMDWLFDRDTKIVLVQLVDYGNIIFVHYKHLRELTKDFCMLPKLAIKCYLPLLYPPGSSKEYLLNDWPMTTVEALRDLAGLCNSTTKIFYKIFYVHKEGDFTGVDMYEVGHDELNSVGQLLIDLGHAVQIVLPSDDPMGIVTDDKDIERLENCENINEVVLGYDPKDEGRICKFTRKDGTCFKGKNCKLEHLQYLRGGYTTDHILTFCSAANEVVFPQVADCVPIRFTVFLEASHYYINLMQYADSLVRLEKVMNDKKNCATFQQYKIMPAYGEIVLVKHWCKRWMRGKVRHHSYDDEGNCAGVQVFMVDYGDVVDVCLKDIRHIEPEYLELPFQAVECILYNYKARNDVDTKEMDKFFYENMFFREFTGQVIGRSNILLLRVYHKNRDICEILTEQGFLTKVGTRVFPSDNSIVIPG